MRRNVLYGWLPVVLLAALAALTFWLDRAVKLGTATASRDSSAPDVIVEDFAASLLNPDGTQRYALLAHRMEHHADAETTLLERPELTHYSPGNSQVTVRSKNAYVSRDAEEVVFTGEVIVTRAPDARSGPLTMKTSQLSVYPTQDIARSSKEVVLTSDNGTLRGVGLEFNSATRQMRLGSRVHGEFKNPRAGQIDR